MADQRIHTDGITQKYRDISVSEGFNRGSIYAREVINVPELEEKTREGEAWVISYVWRDLGPGAAAFICLVTGDKTLHVRAAGAASDLAWIAVGEGAEWTGGTAVTPYCLNRQTEVAHNLQQAVLDPVFAQNGQIMWTGIIDDDSNWATLGGPGAEWVLAQGTSYHFNISSEVGQGDIHAALTLLLTVY